MSTTPTLQPPASGSLSCNMNVKAVICVIVVLELSFLYYFGKWTENYNGQPYNLGKFDINAVASDQIFFKQSCWLIQSIILLRKKGKEQKNNLVVRSCDKLLVHIILCWFNSWTCYYNISIAPSRLKKLQNQCFKSKNEKLATHFLL